MELLALWLLIFKNCLLLSWVVEEKILTNHWLLIIKTAKKNIFVSRIVRNTMKAYYIVFVKSTIWGVILSFKVQNNLLWNVIFLELLESNNNISNTTRNSKHLLLQKQVCSANNHQNIMIFDDIVSWLRVNPHEILNSQDAKNEKK